MARNKGSTMAAAVVSMSSIDGKKIATHPMQTGQTCNETSSSQELHLTDATPASSACQQV